MGGGGLVGGCLTCARAMSPSCLTFNNAFIVTSASFELIFPPNGPIGILFLNAVGLPHMEGKVHSMGHRNNLDAALFHPFASEVDLN